VRVEQSQEVLLLLKVMACGFWLHLVESLSVAGEIPAIGRLWCVHHGCTAAQGVGSRAMQQHEQAAASGIPNRFAMNSRKSVGCFGPALAPYQA
jgi:hypothetical protein